MMMKAVHTSGFLLLLFLTLIEAFAPSRWPAKESYPNNRHFAETNDADDNDDDISLGAFQARRQQQEEQEQQQQEEDEEKFDGYALRDVIFEKWGKCYDAEFNKVDSFGVPQLYLNILPFHLGGRGNFRHETELDYLCHLQAVVDILEKYNQVGWR
jgi:hypothetical protein